ncbi:MAG: DUF1425 domain-containing protein [Planctomycetota bacterium]
MADDYGAQPQVNIPDAWRDSITEVGRGRAIETRSGANLSVAKSLRNREPDDLHAEFKFTFLDAQGVPLRQQVDWRPMTMAPQMETVFMGTSLGPAEDWRLEIRMAAEGSHR